MTLGRTKLKDIDLPSIETILQLQLKDVEPLASNAKAKQREGSISDKEEALQSFVNDLAASIDILSDRIMAQTLAMQSQRDVLEIEEKIKRPPQTIRDHELARYLARSADPSPDSWIWGRKSLVDHKHPLRELWPILLDFDSEGPSMVGESSAWVASRRTRSSQPKGHSIVCAEDSDLDALFRVPCEHQHSYCRNCLAQLFWLSMEKESTFPPRCDGHEIPLQLVQSFLPSGLVKRFELRSAELRTQNRTYSQSTTCPTFIPRTAMNETVGPKPPHETEYDDNVGTPAGVIVRDYAYLSGAASISQPRRSPNAVHHDRPVHKNRSNHPKCATQ